MNWDQVKGQWTQLRGQAKQKWGQLTDDDLDTVAGHKDELVGKVQARYGKSKEEAEREIEEWTNTL